MAAQAAAAVPEPRVQLLANWLPALHETLYGDTDRATELLPNDASPADSSLMRAFLDIASIQHAEKTGNPQLALDIALRSIVCQSRDYSAGQRATDLPQSAGYRVVEDINTEALSHPIGVL